MNNKEQTKFIHALHIREDLCIGCSHCMNVCPTEAIRVKNGKSVLYDDRCVDCGECFRVCPVNAIIINHDDFSRIYDYTQRIALLPAVFTGQFPEELERRMIYSALLELGFTHVYEVEKSTDLLKHSIEAELNKNTITRPLISSFCPAIIRLIQVKFPALVDNIIRLKPPLDISAHYVRNQLIKRGTPAEEIGIFYVTPCAAKIAAIKDPVGETGSPIAGVINMDFLYNKVFRLVKQNNFVSCALPVPEEMSQMQTCWSLTGGESQHLPGRCLAIDEIHNVIEILEKIENDEISELDYLELRACDESCAGGVLTTANRFLTAEKLRNHTSKTGETSSKAHPESIGNAMNADGFESIALALDAIGPRSIIKLDENMGEAMKKMEKVNRIMQLLPMVDCGICGAPSCQALARDIVQSDATIKQCIFIQKILEQRGELSLEEGVEIMQKVWGYGKTNKYRDIKGY